MGKPLNEMDLLELVDIYAQAQKSTYLDGTLIRRGVKQEIGRRIELATAEHEELERLREQCHEPTLTCPDCGRTFPWDDTEHYCMGTLTGDKVFGLQQVVKPR